MGGLNRPGRPRATGLAAGARAQQVLEPLDIRDDDLAAACAFAEDRWTLDSELQNWFSICRSARAAGQACAAGSGGTCIEHQGQSSGHRLITQPGTCS